MPLPASLTTKQVHAKFTNVDGSPASGAVTFDTSPYTLRAQADDVIIPVGTILGTLDSAGEMTVTLPVTDDPDVAPTGWAYTVTETILGRPERTYQIQISESEPATVELADIIPTVPVPTLGEYVTQGDLEAAVDAAMASSAELADAINDQLSTQKGAANGIAELDATVHVPVAQIPDLDAAKITSGVFATARIPDLSGAKITSGTVAETYIDTALARDSEVAASYQALSEKNTASGYAGLDASTLLALAQIPDLPANQTTSGEFDDARIPSTITRDSEAVLLTGAQNVGGAKTFTALATFSAGISPTTITAGSWTALTGTYVNSYTAYAGSVFYTPAYRIIHGTNGDTIQLRGRIDGGAFTDGENILTGLPSEARPGRVVRLSVASDVSDNGIIEITETGNIVNESTFPSNWISLDGVTYYKGPN